MTIAEANKTGPNGKTAPTPAMRDGGIVAHDNVAMQSATSIANLSEQQTSDDGRDVRGRFMAGRKGGPGAPFKNKVTKLRAAIMRATSQRRIVKVWMQMVTLAEAGDVQAATFVFDRLFGKSPQPLTLGGTDNQTPNSTQFDFAAFAAIFQQRMSAAASPGSAGVARTQVSDAQTIVGKGL